MYVTGMYVHVQLVHVYVYALPFEEYFVTHMILSLSLSLLLQSERAASEKAISAAVAEERERHSTIITDMKVGLIVP